VQAAGVQDDPDDPDDRERLRAEAEDAGLEEFERQQSAAFLDRLAAAVPVPVLTALRSHPDEVHRLMQIVEVSDFAPDPEADERARLQAVQVALEAVAAIAGSVGTAAASKASAASRRAAVAGRDARILKLWATVGKGRSDRCRAQIVRNRLGKYAPSVRQIIRIAKGQQK
jgi:hypothetical protein